MNHRVVLAVVLQQLLQLGSSSYIVSLLVAVSKLLVSSYPSKRIARIQVFPFRRTPRRRSTDVAFFNARIELRVVLESRALELLSMLHDERLNVSTPKGRTPCLCNAKLPAPWKML
jgi:hypothetical protein